MYDRMQQDSYTGGDALLDALITHGAHTAFGVPGESYLAALDAIARRGAQFNFVTCRHEAGASNMAEAAGKLTGQPGLCFVTRGPGATHATIGLHTAFQDSTPMIIIVGDVARDQRDREAFQEVDYHQFLAPVTKLVLRIDDPARVAEYVGRAWRTALAGRPGPVAIAVPEDVLTGPAPQQQSRPHKILRPQPDIATVKQAISLFGQAKRPLILVGGSGWTRSAVKKLENLAERHHLPVVASFRAQDRMDNRHKCYVGDMGIGANPALVKRMQESDLILALGPRLGEMTTAGYTRLRPPCPGMPLIHVHQGAEELGSVYQADVLINSSPEPFLDALKSQGMPIGDTWEGWCAGARQEYTAWSVPTANDGPVQLAQIYALLNDRMPDDVIYANGAGTYSIWLHRFAKYRQFPSQLAPTSGAMGYGVGAAVAAKILQPERPVLCFGGDGCFLMGSTELATAVQHKAGVLFLVFNNGLYGSIRMHQARSYPGRIAGTELMNPDFAALAESFGAFGRQVASTQDFPAALEDALAATHKGQPALIEIAVDPNVITPATTLSAIEAKNVKS